MKGAFIDSNILLYAISGREEEKEKALIARELLLKADSHISIQVLNEFTVNATSAGNTDYRERWRAGIAPSGNRSLPCIP